MKRVSSFSTSAISRHPIFSQFSQLSQQVADTPKPYIYFVIPPGKTVEECMKLNLGEMFQAAEAHSLNVKWIEDKACKNQELTDDGNVFVFDPFGSPGFRYCVTILSGDVRVDLLSPAVIRQVFTDPQQYSFETGGYPVYTLAMRNMVICLSGFNKEVKEELETLVRWMNGKVVPSLTKVVTHVVTASAITPKCIEANKEQIPLMIEDWVRQVWKDNQSLPVDAKDPRYVTFICPTFYNVNICMSQLTAARKNALKTGIEQKGGKCSSELVKKVTHILVVPNASGDKFKFAQKWNVKCVTPEWVENSIEKKHLLSLDDYKVVSSGQEFEVPHANGIGRPIVTSTPAHSIMPDWNMTRCSDIIDENRLVVEASKANFTRNTTEIHDETMAQLRVIAANGTYLEGCMVYLVEYEKCDELKREINKSGATRLNELREGVTHVIVVNGQKFPKSIQDKINNLESRPYIVTVDWVLQSARDGSPADEERFKFEQVDTICQETFNEPPSSANLSSRVHRVSATTIENQPQETVTSYVTVCTVGLGKNTSGSTSRTTTDAPTKSSNNSSSSGTSAGSKSNSRTEATDSESEDSDATQHENDVENQVSGEVGSEGLFVGLTFKVVLLDEEEQKFLEGLISDNGGRIVGSDPEVAILPPICSQVEMDKVDQSYTKFWVFECLDSNSLSIENSFHHVPLASFKKMNEVMRGVVVAVSQYQSSERAYITEVITALGARCQEVFARKDSIDGKNLKSTHLICKNMDTDKAKAAKKWGVPVVIAEWVTDSFNEKKRLDEAKYNPSQINTSDERTVFMATPQRRRTMKANQNTNNMSVRSVYPPSTQKGGPNIVVNKKNNAVAGHKKYNNNKEKTLPPEEQIPSTSAAKPGPSGDMFRAPVAALPTKSPVATSSKSANQPTTDHVQGANDDSKEDNFLKRPPLPPFPPQEEIDRKMAEYKAMFPYSEESFEALLEDIKARGVNLDDVSPFTSFEERRLCDPNPDSPILLGLPRQESRALKEQFDIALNRTPNNPKIKMKTPTSTPLAEIVKRFNAATEVRSRQEGSPSASPHHTSTPTRENLRRRATLNRLSQGNPNTSRNQSESEDKVGSPVLATAGIRKLGNKRPSDGSPEEDSNSNKRVRKSSDDDDDIEAIMPRKLISQNENNVPIPAENSRGDEEKSSSSKKPTKMEYLANLVAAHADPNPIADATGGSPIKRRSADVANMLIPCDEVHEEIERPHLSWIDNDDEQKNKKSTVKKVIAKPRIPQPEVIPVEPEESKPEEQKKRPSRMKKAPSVANVEETGTERVIRRTRSRSKAGREDSAPLGHQPIKIADTKKSKTKKSVAVTFPVELPENPIFAISSLDAQEKNWALKIITRLGGTVTKVAYFDMNCHALITTKLLRSEKILGCIASGKYILNTEYLEKSEKAGHFLPIDEEFMWHESNVKEDKERELARAAYGWLKLQMEGKNKKAMTGMKFYILDQPAEKVGAFERLIFAAGGEIVDDLHSANCVIKDDKTVASIPDGVQIANPLYLNTLILTVGQSAS